MKKSDGSFSPKHEVFISEYVATLNGSEAARRAGSPAKSAANYASRLLTNPEIKAEVDKRIAARTVQTKMSAGEIITRIENQATADIAIFLKPGTLELDPEMVHEFGHLIQSIILTKDGWRIRMYDAQKALELLGKTKALFVERQVLEMLEGMEVIDTDGQEISNQSTSASFSASADRGLIS